MKENDIPEFILNDKVDKAKYLQWIDRKTRSLFKRDQKRAQKQKITFAYKMKNYKESIIEAINKSEGKDFYTGEMLRWDLISQYRDKKLHMLPTIDHMNSQCEPNFVVCSWKMNDAKNDLSGEDFECLCIKFLAHRYLNRQEELIQNINEMIKI